MSEKAVMVALFAFYAIMIGVCLWVMYCIFNAVFEIIRELIEDIHEEGKYEKEKQVNAAGPPETGTELSGSNGGNAEEEESDEWQKKKS